MKPEIVIAVDIGTTTLKLIAFDQNGRIIDSEFYQYQIQLTTPLVMQNLNELVTNFQLLLEQLTQRLSQQYLILNITFSCAMHSFLLLDHNHQPISDIILWTDPHSFGELEIPIDLFHQKTGIFRGGFLPAFKLGYINFELQKWWTKIAKVVSIKEYLIYLLTEQFVIDYAMASGTGLFNLQTRNWDQEILTMLKVSEKWLSKLVSPQTVLRIINKRWNLPEQLDIVVGIADGISANLATGYYDQDILTISLGTSTGCRYFWFTIPSKIPTNEYFMLFDEEIYMRGFTSSNEVNNFNWFLQQQDYSLNFALTEFAKQIAEQSLTNDFYFPYLVKERIWKEYDHEKFYLTTAAIEPKQLIQIVVEGILFNCKSIIDNLAQKNEQKFV
ncbi:hypothetical protein GL981_07440 [Spiroplasma citri]|uniref:Carbohydrate kinase FGGY N-terminal domain-containing protein n=1 Tax=Spiroplasma citri TaxID=2133 RepID=A0AAJ4EK63_SPICI|nr:FGGY family carbohydrate kinase [Spiroplasma citri]QIA69323.1 hypothetical protein GL298_07385 [Spiroplasma citri]QIA71190.1 hypothetical protein GL981_07440 [Spiroplasma citri]